MDIQQTLRYIKQELRTVMNGVASARMRESGIGYKLNFGVELPRLRDMAEHLPADHELAQALWKENARECRILAGMIQPVETFCPEMADIWVENMHVTELARLTVMNLFARLPYAADCAFRWMADERPMFRLCGLLLMARLFMQGVRLNERAENEFVDQATTALHDVEADVRQAAIAALQKYGDTGPDACRRAESALRPASET